MKVYIFCIILYILYINFTFGKAFKRLCLVFKEVANIACRDMDVWFERRRCSPSVDDDKCLSFYLLLVIQYTGRIKPFFATEADRQICCLKAGSQ
jgi:hypothetical protein